MCLFTGVNRCVYTFIGGVPSPGWRTQSALLNVPHRCPERSNTYVCGYACFLLLEDGHQTDVWLTGRSITRQWSLTWIKVVSEGVCFIQTNPKHHLICFFLQLLQKALQLYLIRLCQVQRGTGASTPSVSRLSQTKLASKGHITFMCAFVWIHFIFF